MGNRILVNKNIKEQLSKEFNVSVSTIERYLFTNRYLTSLARVKVRKRAIEMGGVESTIPLKD